MRAGFTIIELLIVITIVAILAMIALLAISPLKQINKGYDAVRKKDLVNLKIVFEDYYGDHLCYPPAEILDVCGGSQLLPYTASVPCDPQTREKYLYVPEANICSGYRILTTLMDKTDPYIEKVGCINTLGCGTGGDASYNYGISSSGISVGIYGPPYLPGNYACDVDWNCNDFGEANGCSVSYSDAQVCSALCTAHLGSRCL